jgi:hypothetical protein
VADLLTHGAVAVLVKAGTGWRYPAVFVAGTFAPDLASRVPAIGLGLVHVHWLALPPWLTHGWQPLHQPLGMFVLAYLLSMFFRVEERVAVFLNLVGGMALHMVLDVVQDHHGVGYLLGFPLSEGHWELGAIGSEATVWVALPMCAIAAVVASKKKASSGASS